MPVRVARFASAGADPRFGIVDDDEVVVLKGDPMFVGFDTTGERAAARRRAPARARHPRSKVVCVGLNYAEHRADMANVDAPENPLIFLKPNTAVVGPGDDIQIRRSRGASPTSRSS